MQSGRHPGGAVSQLEASAICSLSLGKQVVLAEPLKVVGSLKVQQVAPKQLGKWVLELNGYLVECPVVNARPQASILFCHKEETRSSRRSGWMDGCTLAPQNISCGPGLFRLMLY